MHARRWDIFCTVVDNFGDIGICWRLARQLAGEHGAAVRLWVDDLAAFRHIEPRVIPDSSPQTIEGIAVCLWTLEAVKSEAPAEVVVEAFACSLPDSYLSAMASIEPAPRWINLEYLSAEDWVGGCHKLPSRHPQLGLDKYFFFPGFSPHTGGLLKESGLDARRQSFQSDPRAQRDFWLQYDLPAPSPEELRVSLFAYENPALPDLLDAWSAHDRPIYCAVPTGRVLPGIAAWLMQTTLQPGNVITRGALRLVILPFMAQADYDRLLWVCDLNFVRGEDSFVRAQWARRPFVWQIYPQADDAHWPKLEAFLQQYAGGMTEASAPAFWRAWNGRSDLAAAWPAFSNGLPSLRRHAEDWADKLAAHGDLTANLVNFCNQS